jgi:rhodanese-related sulfurtransferase
METQITYYEQKLKFEIDSWDLSEQLKSGEKIVLIDTRSKESFENEHIIGAVSIPHRSMSIENTGNLDKDCLYITYCDGIGCNASTKGALNMSRLGFKVKELIGGIEWWKRDGYETQGKKWKVVSRIQCDC